MSGYITAVRNPLFFLKIAAIRLQHRPWLLSAHTYLLPPSALVYFFVYRLGTEVLVPMSTQKELKTDLVIYVFFFYHDIFLNTFFSLSLQALRWTVRVLVASPTKWTIRPGVWRSSTSTACSLLLTKVTTGVTNECLCVDHVLKRLQEVFVFPKRFNLAN